MKKEVSKVKEAFEKDIEVYKVQVAELQNSLRLVDKDKLASVETAKEEAERLVEECMEEHKKEHDDALVKAENQGYAGIPIGNDLYKKEILCQPSWAVFAGDFSAALYFLSYYYIVGEVIKWTSL